MQTIKSLGVLSVGKIMGILYALMGLLVAPVFLLFSAIGALAGQKESQMGLVFAVIFTIFVPIFYGGIGFIGGVIMAFLYNLIASRLGGIEIELQSPASPQPQMIPPADPGPAPPPIPEAV